jgi:hypothetical protein
MKNLSELRDRLEDELGDEDLFNREDEINDEDEEDGSDTIFDDDDAEKEVKPDRNSMVIIRLDNQDRIKGRINKLEFEINYKELSDKINEHVPGVIITKIKARQMMDIVREMMGIEKK